MRFRRVAESTHPGSVLHLFVTSEEQEELDKRMKLEWVRSTVGQRISEKHTTEQDIQHEHWIIG